ncbi:MAG: OmpA family protein [Bacteroidota bacterium]
MRCKFLIVASLFVGLSSCVSKKKYVAALRLHQNWEDRANALADELSQEREVQADLRRQVADVDYRFNQLRMDSIQRQAAVNTCLENLQRSNHKMETLRLTLDSLAMREIAVEVEQTANPLLSKMESTLKKRFRQYSDSEISYTTTNEKIKMIFSDSLLFQRASLKLNSRGLRSIGTLSLVLEKYPQIQVVVVGHTDDVPIRRKNIRDNWDLSALRASTIVRILHRDFNIDAHRLTIQSQGQFDNLASNNSPSGRASNRRTEIILNPPPPKDKVRTLSP